ncbi:MAG: hypothetical protein VSS75_035080 [Candidatus Parabeggiatoa sp.]|nr:hypothetical protein [Candidatus Parabeggiatoa sp.]
MQVTADEVKELLKKLIEESISPEEVAQWAVIRMQANDEDQLEFLPENEYLQIWDTLLYFSGVDLKMAPDSEYFHGKNNFIQKLYEIWGEQL